MSIPYLLYKSHEPALMNAFQGSLYTPQVEAVTYSDMVSTGGGLYSSRVKLSFTAKRGPYVRFYMYIPGSLVSELLHLTEEERAAVAAWIQSVETEDSLCKSALKQRANNKV
jgi:hypothetical protein